MRAALAYELVRLRTVRSTWVLTGLALALTAVSALALSVSPGSEGADPRGDVQAYASVLTGAVPVVALAMGLLGAFAFGHEYRYGTMRTALVVLPDRTVLGGAKVLVLALWSGAVAALGVLLAVVLQLATGRGRFQPGVGLSSPGVPRVAAGAVLYVVLFALFGVAFGWLLRSLPAAVTLLLLLPFVAEPFLRLLLDTPAFRPVRGLGSHLPFTAGARLYVLGDADQGLPGLSDGVGPLVGGLTMASVVAVLLGLALLAYRLRDA